MHKYILFLLTSFFLALTPHAQEQWQPGDLIFRQGNEPVSDMVMMLDEQTAYSHVGMLIGGPQHWQVVHATPEEVKGRGDVVVIDDLAFFTSPERSLSHTVYHVNATEEQRKQAVELAVQRLGEPFSIDNGDGLYCTTLVWWAWRDAGVDLQVRFTEVSLPLLQGNYLMPSGLLVSPLLNKVNSNEK